MAKFISRFRGFSTKFNPAESAKPGLIPSNNQSQPIKRRRKKVVKSSAKRLASNVKKLSSQAVASVEGSRLAPILRPFQGPKPVHRNRLFWLGLGLSSGLFALGIGWWSLKRTLPDTSSIFTFVRDGTLTIKAADGTILQQSGPATREKLTMGQFPKTTVEAFIAAEDRRFYQHQGVDYQGILRAALSNVVSGDLVQGGSTITQQVARIVFLNQERSITRKLKEAMLAQELERQMPKEQILERYLNLVYLGSGAYGVADAAWVYFSKPVDKLTLPETAMIAGLPPAPSVYSPLVNPETAVKRRNVVLQRMEDAGYISKAEMDQAIAAPLQLKPSTPKRLVIEAPYFTSYVQQELPKYVSPEALELGGLTVETTLNRQWQKAAEKVIKDAVELDGWAEGFGQAALVAIDPRNGQVKALVGGDGYGKSQFNRATQAQRQPGSTFKPLVYTTAIAAGFSPTDGYLDAQYTVDGYKPQNYGKTYRGWVSMRDALTYSVNVVAVKVLIDVGFDPVVKMAKDMGIQSKLMPTYSLALGASEVNLLELTSAYGTLAAQGNAVPPHGITRILNRQGEVLYSADFKPKRVVDKGTASILTWMLESVVQSGTGRPAQLGRPVAGKTGTSEEARDLWFIGYIPQVVTGVWLGNDNNDPTWGSSGTAAHTWREFMTKVVQGMPVQKFPELPSFEGRKGSIKAKPVTPKRELSGSTAPETGSASSESSGGGYDSGSSNDSGGGYDSGGSYDSRSSYDSGGYDDSAPSEPAAPEPVAEEAPPSDYAPESEAPVEEAPVEEAPAEPAPPTDSEPAPPAY